MGRIKARGCTDAASALDCRNNYVEQPFLAPGYSNFERCRPAGQFLPALTAPTGHRDGSPLCWPSHGCHCLQPVISGCWPLNIKLQVLPLGLPKPPGLRCTVLPGLRRRSPAGTVGPSARPSTLASLSFFPLSDAVVLSLLFD